MFNGLLFQGKYWPNLKSIALPVPEIITIDVIISTITMSNTAIRQWGRTVRQHGVALITARKKLSLDNVNTALKATGLVIFL